MSRPKGKMRHRPRSPGLSSARARATDAGIARGPGLAVAGVIAAIVFAIGHHFFPIRPREVPAPTVATAGADAGPPVAMAAADAGAVAAPPAAEAGTVAAKIADAGAAVAVAEAGRTATPEKAEAAEAPTSAKPTAEETPSPTSADRKLDKQRQQDRDLAREAWRRNRPDISVTGNKTSVLIPIKGSIKGADFKITDKRRTVTVTLPKAVSMVTMRIYNLKHPSFKKLWIDQDEANAQPEDGTKLRLILSQAFDPQVEITDDFVRVTIRRPEPAAAPAERSEKRSEKQADRAEKKAEPADDSPAPEKETE